MAHFHFHSLSSLVTLFCYLAFLADLGPARAQHLLDQQETWKETDDEELVRSYVHRFGNQTFREPAGHLRFKYLVPAGYYQQMWDWDSMTTGVALLSLGSAPYLAGSMMNFLSAVDLTTGMVKGCLTPSGAQKAIYHAKPVLLAGAWIAAKAMGNYDQFRQFLPQMLALDSYWENTRRDVATGLYRWHDQMESGCDNLVTSQCPSRYGSGPPHILHQCWKESEADSLASPDIMVFLFREKIALSNFLHKFGNSKLAVAVRTSAAKIKAALNEYLWVEETGTFVAFNTSAKHTIQSRTFLMGFPLFGGPGLINQRQAERSFAELSLPDMMSPFGIRSTSCLDPRYSNAKYIIPYSNWRGPIWINANVFLVYGLVSFGMREQALDVATKIVSLLAAGIRRNPIESKRGKAWRECYSSDDGRDLAADGFLNWNTLAGSLLDNLRKGVNPFQLDPEASDITTPMQFV